MFVVGLTGDVGAGKSTLVRTWHSLGASVISADEVAKRQWQRPEVISSIIERWGENVMSDGVVDYANIARRAFADEDEYRYMNSLIHPGTRVEINRQVAVLHGWVVAEIPLLFEVGRHPWIDYVVYVTAPQEFRVGRNASRGWDEDEIKRRERFLLDPVDKQRMSDMVLNNDRDEESWIQSVKNLGNIFLKMSSVYELSTYCGSQEEAEKIAAILVGNKHVACVNIASVKSSYRWNGETRMEPEWSLLCKTTEGSRRGAMECIKANHSYKLPAITSTELCHSDAATLKWVVDSCEG